MDYLVKTLVWVLVVYGTATVFAQSSIMKPLRDWITYRPKEKEDQDFLVLRKWELPGKLIHCIMCMGWWSGAFWGTVWWDPCMSDNHQVIVTILTGMLGLGSTWIIALNLAEAQKGQ